LGLEPGTEDDLARPSGFRDLLTRISAVTGRTVVPPDGARRQQIAELEIDRRERQVHLAGVELFLTTEEVDLLACLAEEPGAVVTRQEVLAQDSRPNWYGSSRTLDAHIAAIRKKLGDPCWIESVRGVGYCIGVAQ